ncbi:uncharacterized protein [Fopius arisanus]|uniref:Uncharacterized protein n=1 Tax=Fopius arisanus TaxID=64838 RepID=A0A9R1TWM4_9HYME|nr:PREDICTED: uncharacterized protein LOC105263950 [Fopius arisanus]
MQIRQTPVAQVRLRVMDTMDTTRSTEIICCQGGSTSGDDNDVSNRGVILSWDKFNTRIWLVFVGSFVVWAVAFFLAYQPGNGSMDHGSMDHGSMDHGSMDHGGMHH